MRKKVQELCKKLDIDFDNDIYYKSSNISGQSGFKIGVRTKWRNNNQIIAIVYLVQYGEFVVWMIKNDSRNYRSLSRKNHNEMKCNVINQVRMQSKILKDGIWSEDMVYLFQSSLLEQFLKEEYPEIKRKYL